MATRYRCGYLDSFTELEARSGLERNLIFRFSFQDVEQMKITLITACYNSAETIGTAMESVLSQKGVDVEHIVVDGGSKDGTVDIINLPWNLNLKTAVGGEFFLTQRRREAQNAEKIATLLFYRSDPTNFWLSCQS